MRLGCGMMMDQDSQRKKPGGLAGRDCSETPFEKCMGKSWESHSTRSNRPIWMSRGTPTTGCAGGIHGQSIPGRLLYTSTCTRTFPQRGWSAGKLQITDGWTQCWIKEAADMEPWRILQLMHIVKLKREYYFGIEPAPDVCTTPKPRRTVATDASFPPQQEQFRSITRINSHGRGMLTFADLTLAYPSCQPRERKPKRESTSVESVHHGRTFHGTFCSSTRICPRKPQKRLYYAGRPQSFCCGCWQ